MYIPRTAGGGNDLQAQTISLLVKIITCSNTIMPIDCNKTNLQRGRVRRRSIRKLDQEHKLYTRFIMLADFTLTLVVSFLPQINIQPMVQTLIGWYTGRPICLALCKNLSIASKKDVKR